MPKSGGIGYHALTLQIRGASRDSWRTWPCVHGFGEKEQQSALGSSFENEVPYSHATISDRIPMPHRCAQPKPAHNLTPEKLLRRFTIARARRSSSSTCSRASWLWRTIV